MSTTNERIPEDVLLDVLLEHQDFKDFKKNGNSYRNPSGEQSLTEKGLKDFKSEDFSNLQFHLSIIQRWDRRNSQ